MSEYVAVTFVAPSPNAQVLGSAMSSYVQNIRAEELQPVLKKYGLESIEPNQWYPMQLTLDLFRDIVKRGENVNEALVAVGIKTVETVPLPPEINSVETAMGFIQRAVHSQIVRNVPEGYGIPLQFLEKNHILATNNIPYPSSLLYGYLWGLVNRFKAPDQIFSIHPLTAEAGRPTVFSVKWGLPDEVEMN